MHARRVKRIGANQPVKVSKSLDEVTDIKSVRPLFRAKLCLLENEVESLAHMAFDSWYHEYFRTGEQSSQRLGNHASALRTS